MTENRKRPRSHSGRFSTSDASVHSSASCEASEISSLSTSSEHSNWELSDWQLRADGDARNLARGAEIKEELLQKLLREEYGCELQEMQLMNPQIHQQIKRLCTSNSRDRSDRTSNAVPCSAHNFGVSALMVMMHRMHTHHSIHFITACMSLIAVRNNLDKIFWGLLSALGLLFSYSFSQDLALELGERVGEKHRDGDHMKSIVIAAVDNKGYMMRHPEHTENARQSQFTQTANWLIALIASMLNILEIYDSPIAAST